MGQARSLCPAVAYGSNRDRVEAAASPPMSAMPPIATSVPRATSMAVLFGRMVPSVARGLLRLRELDQISLRSSPHERSTMPARERGLQFPDRRVPRSPNELQGNACARLTELALDLNEPIATVERLSGLRLPVWSREGSTPNKRRIASTLLVMEYKLHIVVLNRVLSLATLMVANGWKADVSRTA